MGDHDENISFETAAALVGRPMAARVRDTAIALYHFAAEHAATARHHHRRHQVRVRPGPGWRADPHRRSADAGLLAFLASRAATGWACSPPSFDKQFVRDYLETLDWNKQAPGPRLPAAGDPRRPPRTTQRHCAGLPGPPARLKRASSGQPYMWQQFWKLLDHALFGPHTLRRTRWRDCCACCAIPTPSLRDLIGGELNLRATGLVYATLLALIPLIALSFAVLKAFGAHREMEPFLLEFFRPVGDAGPQIVHRLMEFAENVRGGLVGVVGLALLLWTLVGTVKKVEDSMNFVWRVPARPQHAAPGHRIRGAAHHRPAGGRDGDRLLETRLRQRGELHGGGFHARREGDADPDRARALRDRHGAVHRHLHTDAEYTRALPARVRGRAGRGHPVGGDRQGRSRRW